MTEVEFEKGYRQRGYSLWLRGYRMIKETTKTNKLTGDRTNYWKCEHTKCLVRATTINDSLKGSIRKEHNHPADFDSQTA